ncbi:MAG TPA: glucosamine-6-phosphate deaminase [Candidatus Limnocylindria bacterium]|nr:glucosamine-6-phosphate deaminase [Candidatus Limnocylindria bacterium]
MPIEVRVVADADALAVTGAGLVADAIRADPELTILAATGDTPMGIYAALADLVRRGELDASRVHVAQLDEYAGVAATDRRSLFGWTRRAVLEPLGVHRDRTVRLDGEAADRDAACRAYDAAIAGLGGIALAILGLGPNGHLGFNEPPSPADAPTRPVPLTPQSVESNARYWGSAEEVPRLALTAGMSTILGARRVLLVVSGAHKRPIVSRLLGSNPDPRLPASHLHAHPAAILLADDAAIPGGAD